MMRSEGESGAAPGSYVEKLDTHGFELGERLGMGAFGTVYRGVQKQFNRPVAVKFFNGGLFGVGPDDRDRFEKEAQLLSRVEHPSVPYVLTAGQVRDGKDTVPYFVMQLVPGEPLDSVIFKRKRLDLATACGVMTEVLGALQAVHARQILHRDIKPNNILVAEGRAWLVDFSLGASLKYEPGLTRGTVPRRGLGVADYAAPEQILDATKCDNRADIYSAGVILFEMLSGHPRLQRDDLASQLAGYPAGLSTVVATACALDRDDRYRDAHAFLSALDQFRAGEVIDENARWALCINRKCRAAHRSPNGYYFGPRVGEIADHFCSSCGSGLVRRCQKCSRPLSQEVEEIVVKRTRSADDRGSLFCPRCGNMIFEYPKCSSCSSLLKEEDLEADTAALGCSKCRRKGTAPTPAPPTVSNDDDIPF